MSLLCNKACFPSFLSVFLTCFWSASSSARTLCIPTLEEEESPEELDDDINSPLLLSSLEEDDLELFSMFVLEIARK